MFTGDSAQTLVVAVMVAMALLAFWRVVLTVLAVALLSVMLLGVAQVAQWVQALS